MSQSSGLEWFAVSNLKDSSDLVDTASTATLFTSRAWFERWLASFGGRDSGWWRPPPPSLLEFPYVKGAHRIGPISLNVAWGAANSYSPRFDVCGLGIPTAEDFRRMMHELDVSTLVFPLLSGASRLARAFHETPSGLWWFRDFCEAAPFVKCTGSWEAYLASRGRTRRKSWLSYERNAAKAGMSVEILSLWSDISRNFDQMLAVEASGWKGKLGSSIVQNPKARSFYEGFCREFASLDALRVFILRSEQRIVAFQICALDAGILTGLKSGYLEEYAKDSPGQALHLHIVRWAFSQPNVHLYDMLGPTSPTKMKWATGVDELSTIYVFRRGVGGRVARLRWAIAPMAKAWLRTRMSRSTPAVSDRAGINAVSAPRSDWSRPDE